MAESWQSSVGGSQQREKLDCIMDGSWWSSVGGSQKVKSWTALWMDNGTCEWQASLRSSTVSLDI